MCGQALGDERWRTTVVAEDDVAEAHGVGRKDRNAHLATDRRIKAGSGTDLCLDCVPRHFRGNQERGHGDSPQANDDQNCER